MDVFEEAKTQSFHLKLQNRLILENKITPTTEAVAQRRPVKKIILRNFAKFSAPSLQLY